MVFVTTSAGQTQRKKAAKPKCATDIGDCPKQGCGTDFDPNLNRRKNIVPSDSDAAGPATPETLTWMKNLADPETFEEGGSREELQQLGEGKKIMVVAYLIAAKAELGGESCNCYLKTAAETDNHLVLVTKGTIGKFPLESESEDASNDEVFHSRELQSITAEFTPRVRLEHPNFTRAKLQPLIDDAEQDALLVRVTGLLMFDSEHFVRNPLVRVNNWEIHPVLKFEVCPAGKTCTANSGWQSLDDM